MADIFELKENIFVRTLRIIIRESRAGVRSTFVPS